MLTFFVVVSWWVVGIAGFVFWWTKDYDFTFIELLVSCIVGVVGPMCWILGYLIHTETDGFMPKVIIKKRGNSEKGVGE